MRYRSTFGLKYLEIIRGTGPDAPEGFVFDGLNDAEADPDFVGCDIPTDPETFSETIPEQATDGCFTPQTEFDAIANTFDTKTRENARVNLIGYGNAFAGRGMSLNDAVEALNPLLKNLGPVSRVLADPETGLRRFFGELADTARIVAPVSDQQAQLFENAAIAFAAISSDPAALQESITEGPDTLRTAIDTLPRQREFLGLLAELSFRLRPGVQDLRTALPSLNSAIEVGTPVLARTPEINRDLRTALVELKRLLTQRTTGIALERLNQAFDASQADPALGRPGTDRLQLLELLVHVPPGRVRPGPGGLELPPGPDQRAARAADDPARPADRERARRGRDPDRRVLRPQRERQGRPDPGPAVRRRVQADRAADSACPALCPVGAER